MAFSISSFDKRIRQDLETMEERGGTVKAGLIEKLRVKKVSPELLHVNPDDEFSDPNIGPNDAIISNYCKIAMRNQSMHSEVFDEPIIVNRLERGGYMILNGHHRWAGALIAHVPTVRISVKDP